MLEQSLVVNRQSMADFARCARVRAPQPLAAVRLIADTAVQTPSAEDAQLISAMFSQLPCVGV